MVGYWCDSVVSKTHNVTKVFSKLCFKCYDSLQFYEEFCTHSIHITVPHDRMKFINSIFFSWAIQITKTPKLNLS